MLTGKRLRDAHRQETGDAHRQETGDAHRHVGTVEWKHLPPYEVGRVQELSVGAPNTAPEAGCSGTRPGDIVASGAVGLGDAVSYP